MSNNIFLCVPEKIVRGVGIRSPAFARPFQWILRFAQDKGLGFGGSSTPRMIWAPPLLLRRVLDAEDDLGPATTSSAGPRRRI